MYVSLNDEKIVILAEESSMVETVVMLKGLIKEQIHQQVEQLRLMQMRSIADQGNDADILRETVQLLIQIEDALAGQEQTMH